MTIRFSARDGELQAWLGQFAQTHDMSKVVRLACYLLAGIQPDRGLLALLEHIQSEQQRHTPGYQAPGRGTRELVGDGLADVMQELAALREVLARQRVPGADLPLDQGAALLSSDHDSDSALAPSSGLDQVRPRRQQPGAGRPGTLSATVSPVSVLDRRAAGRILAETARRYGQEYQRGHFA